MVELQIKKALRDGLNRVSLKPPPKGYRL